MERPKCGDPAAATRKVTSNIGGGKVQVTVDMCAKHLHVYDEISASIRQARQQVAK
ncbi:MAG TPA: hypothetical protein VGP24_05910 [Glaciihabitans sp.]|jgi:hypothetical protein|nr:hypothetical protein [Glaciihabitans sp.]